MIFGSDLKSRFFLRNKKSNVQSENLESILKQSLVKLKKLKTAIESKESLQGHESSSNQNVNNSSYSSISSQYAQLKSRVEALQTERDSFRASWEASEKIVEELTEQWDCLSLRAKIVRIIMYHKNGL